jgi:hypothetical protein
MKTITINRSAKITVTPKGFTITTYGQRFFVRKGAENTIEVLHSWTGERKMLPLLVEGAKFSEFDPLTLFGTRQPKGSVVTEWLKSLWGSSLLYPAMQWVKSSVPLDVLLEFRKPLPGVTTTDTGWHWSCEMSAIKSPKILYSK